MIKKISIGCLSKRFVCCTLWPSSVSIIIHNFPRNKSFFGITCVVNEVNLLKFLAVIKEGLHQTLEEGWSLQWLKRYDYNNNKDKDTSPSMYKWILEKSLLIIFLELFEFLGYLRLYYSKELISVKLRTLMVKWCSYPCISGTLPANTFVLLKRCKSMMTGLD